AASGLPSRATTTSGRPSALMSPCDTASTSAPRGRTPWISSDVAGSLSMSTPEAIDPAVGEVACAGLGPAAPQAASEASPSRIAARKILSISTSLLVTLPLYNTARSFKGARSEWSVVGQLRVTRGGLFRRDLFCSRFRSCLLHRSFLRRGLLRSGLLCCLLRHLLRGCLLRRRLFRRRLLRRGLLAEAPACGLAGLLQQLHHFLERQRSGLAILGDLAVELAVADVRPVAAVEHLDVAVGEGLDDAVARDLFLLFDQEHRAREFDRVRIVFLLERGIHAAALGEGTEAANADAHFLVLVLAQRPRQAEQVDRGLEGDGVHALARAQRGEARLLLFAFGHAADGGVRSVAAQAHADRLAGLGIGAELAGAGGLGAVDRLGLFHHQFLERTPELFHQRHPRLLAARRRVELVLELRGEVVVDVAGEVAAQEVGHRAADVAGAEGA